ncbi:MAG TPA: tRNA (cytidine(56)-2'-O)-methyltransferase [Thermoplasmata archaeon]|nr:tRNA (cytidine(56)-2'-O)-methyltransferase [Thermoplasmata archaeon]
MPPRREPKRPGVEVLRLGHRAGRDPRLTTHLALAARALGADRMWLHPPDPELAARIRSVGERWGGSFEVAGCPDWKRAIREFPGATVQLTMYGQPLDRVLDRVRNVDRVLVVVGGAKVPSALYELARWNASVGNQPHSEVAALAVFLTQLLGLPSSRPWPGARQVIVPSARGKRVRSSA